jgi:hypothetical protein
MSPLFYEDTVYYTISVVQSLHVVENKKIFTRKTHELRSPFEIIFWTLQISLWPIQSL